MADDRLARVISCPAAAEILDELVVGPRRFRELRGLVPLSVIQRALRVLAAEGALRCDTGGSWDGRLNGGAVFALTGPGRQIVSELSALDVWVAVYDRYLNG
ncbi:hypothetical protein [Amycolatopsis sp. MEPSY49]|uniref:hypothetical protein n=1 Tax=Amycolatopsis sp. MEPSY49 TaxID=3151600 RepID=UPI003EF8B66E